jgi:PAS domain S-box-containing protein
MNDATSQIYGYSRDEMIGKSALELDIWFGKEPRDAFINQVRPELRVERYELLERRKSGDLINASVSADIITIGDNPHLLSVIRDITNSKRAEEALQQANKQLNLLSSITRHDILNQLLVLRGYIELSREYLDDKKTLSDFLEKEEKAARTIEEQITFTKDYQNLGVAVPAWQNVNEIIRKAMVELPLRGIHVEPDPANPEVYADPLFEKVFYNLIDTALKYGRDQMKTICIYSQESGASLTIICEDDGIGISAEDKKRLFTKGFGKNTGLGLFLSREILTITGITIVENGVPGKGARFEITVPKGMYRFTGTGVK